MIISYFFLILFIFNFAIGDQCQDSISITKFDRCAINEVSKITINNDYYYFDFIELTPKTTIPLIGINKIDWYINDGIQYTLTYRYQGCTNNLTEQFIANGMYYELDSEPLCANTQIEYYVYNWYSNGDSKTFLSTPSLQTIQSDDNNCQLSFYINPLNSTGGALQSGAIKILHPTCGFNNGTIIYSSKGYSNYHLYLKDDTQFQFEIQPYMTGLYTFLKEADYYLFVDSLECGTEKILITLQNVYSPLKIKFESVPNFGRNTSTVSLSLASGIYGDLNNWNAYGYVVDISNMAIINDWNHTKTPIQMITNFGYSYNDFVQSGTVCQFTDSFETEFFIPQINYTLSRNGNGCLDSVTLTIYPSYQGQTFTLLSLSGTLINFVNNKAIVSSNNDYAITDVDTGKMVFFTTLYSIPKYSIIETSKDSAVGCWKTFNITIGNYENYNNLRLELYFGTTPSIYYPINGVFINIPAMKSRIYYNHGECGENNDFFFLVDLDDQYSPVDNVTIDYLLIQNGTCTDPTIIKYIANTPRGIISGDYSSYSSINETIKVKDTNCKFIINYQISPLIIENSFINARISEPVCLFSQGLIVFNPPTSDSRVLTPFSNNKPMIAYTYGNNSFYISSGINNISVIYKTPNVFCQKTQTVQVSATYNITPQFLVTPVTDCKNPNGKIEITNYQIFSVIILYIPNNPTTMSTNDGIFDGLPTGDYSIQFNTDDCNGRVDISIPTSYDNIEITTELIKNPTCDILGVADGGFRVNVNQSGIPLNDFTILSYNGINSFSNGVYYSASIGINMFSIVYGSCIWKSEIKINTTIDDPQFSLIQLSNQTCFIQPVFKLVSNNPNVIINQVTLNGIIRSEGDYYLTPIYGNPITMAIQWNQFCIKTLSIPINLNNLGDDGSPPPPPPPPPKLKYKIIKADNCNSLKIDLLITNMDNFLRVSINNKLPISLTNSSQAIFYNLPPSSGYLVYYILKNGCSNTEFIGNYELSNGNTKETLDIKIKNDICHSGKGSIQLPTMDTDNYYYFLKKKHDGSYGFTTSTFIQNQNTLSNLQSYTYNITRTCKSIINCYLETTVTIGSDNPSIESITTNDSYDILNNGTAEIKLNYIPGRPPKYEIIGTQLSNTVGLFTNLSPNHYQVRVTITDTFCPITLNMGFSIGYIPPKSTPSPTPSSNTSVVSTSTTSTSTTSTSTTSTSTPNPSDELSTSNTLQFNHLLIVILILTFII
ncbi:hypothetical protein ACTA71_011333 [Dictyostelium dimigraforme]